MRHILKPAATLLVTAAVTTAMLSLAHTFTLEPIAEQARKTQEAGMKQVLAVASEFTEIQAELSGSIIGVYEGFANGQSVGYVVELSPQGYSGNIDMLVGISPADEAITGMRVLRHSETPGLGALAVKESFYSRYDGKKLVPLKVVRSAVAEDEIDAMTSATITTKAITGAVNEAIQWYKEGGGQ